MKKRQIYMVELDTGHSMPKLDDNKNFIENFEAAILLSLLNKGTLTKWQFDLCIDKLRKHTEN